MASPYTILLDIMEEILGCYDKHYNTITGLNGKSPNFYMYALNNPLIVKDPTGRIPLPIITSLISVGVHLITTPPSQVSFGSKQMLKSKAHVIIYRRRNYWAEGAIALQCLA